MLVRRASRARAREHAVRVRDEHEAALVRQQELQRSLPWRSEPFTTPAVTGAAEEAVPPQSQSEPWHAGYQAQQQQQRQLQDAAVDASASMHIQGLQKLLVDVLKEVAMATDPAHRSAAEEMLGEVRAQILAQKMAEGDHMEEVQQQPQPPQQQEEQQEEAEPRGERRTDRASASSEALGQAAAARMGAMDSWLTEQQQQAQVEQQHSAVTPRADASPHSIRSSSSQPRPQSYSQPPAGHRASPSENGASSSAALRRDGAVASSRAASESPARSTRWLRRQHEQQQNQRSPPSRELREQLAVRTPQRGPPRALSHIVSPDTIGGRCDLPMSILD
jgi:hypothetical protein